MARLTRWLKQEAARVQEWRALDAIYAVGEFRLKLWGWKRERRFVVVREQLQETKGSLGKKLFEVPGYTFRVFVTNRADLPEENLARLQPAGLHRATHRGVEIGLGGG